MNAKKPTASKHGSGQHPVVLAFRKKLESIQDGELEDLKKFNAKTEKLITKARASQPPEAAPKEDEEIEETDDA